MKRLWNTILVLMVLLYVPGASASVDYGGLSADELEDAREELAAFYAASASYTVETAPATLDELYYYPSASMLFLEPCTVDYYDSRYVVTYDDPEVLQRVPESLSMLLWTIDRDGKTAEVALERTETGWISDQECPLAAFISLSISAEPSESTAYWGTVYPNTPLSPDDQYPQRVESDTFSFTIQYGLDLYYDCTWGHPLLTVELDGSRIKYALDTREMVEYDSMDHWIWSSGDAPIYD